MALRTGTGELIREALREKECLTAEKNMIHAKLIAAEESARKHGWVMKTPEEILGGFRKKAHSEDPYRLSPSAEADL